MDLEPQGTTGTPGTDLTMPVSGEIVDLRDANACGRALNEIRLFERELTSQIREAKALLQFALAEQARTLGSKTLHLEGGLVAEVSSGIERVYDAEAVERGLREAGMPEERIREIVEETVSYKVKAVEAKRAAAANPDYERVISANVREVPKPVYVSIGRGRPGSR